MEEMGIALSITCVVIACEHGKGVCNEEPGLVTSQRRFLGDGVVRVGVYRS